MKWKTVICTILDAKYDEDIGTEEKPTYKNWVELTLRDNDSNLIFSSELTSDLIQQMFGMRRNLTSRELIKFAKELRDRTEPLRFMIPDDGKTTKITSDIIELSEDLDKEEPIELNDDNTIKNMSKNFNIKKRRRK